MAVFQVDSSLGAVERIGREAGGYLSARQDRSITIRVPRDLSPVANQEVHDASLLSSIPWLRDLGLPALLGGQP